MVRSFLSIAMSAVSNCSLYSKDHASVEELGRKAFSILNTLLEESERLELMIVGEDLIVNKSPLKDIGIQGKNLLKRLRKKGITRVDILRGVSYAEMKQWIAGIASVHEEIKGSAHIKVGTVDVRIGGLRVDGEFVADMAVPPGLPSVQVEKVKDLYQGVSPFKKLNMTGLEDIVVNFILTFKREVNILKLISPVKSYSEYTYTHATNVTVLSLFQAESLGFKDDLLRDIGIAALLHDVGKLFMSKELLEKKVALDEWERSEIRLHPVYGAKFLAKMDGVPRLATIVAMEHHLRYDGTGYPVYAMGKKQHLCSQIVAIADFFDALRSQRPYRKALEVKEVLALIKKDAGSAFNPFLVDNFLRSMQAALSE